MKKFILFNSPIFWDATKEKEQYLSPLGLGYIATYLEKAGIITVSKAILESGIDLKGYFIYGFPGETKEDFQKTYELASKIKEISTNTTGTFRTSVFQFRPYHGTQLYNEIVKSTGIIHECEFNQSISKFEGRSQFNFDFGNYSKEKDEILSQYIIKTQELTKEEK